MDKILLLGGGGYIGSFLKKKLEEKTYFVQSVDLGLFRAGFDYDGNIPIDYRTLTQEYISMFDTVILLAAHSSVSMAMSNPYRAFQNNVVGFVDLIYNKLSKDQKIIYASSSSVYNDQYDAKEVDDTWFRPTNIYDSTKFEMDIHTRVRNEKDGPRIWGLRLGTVNGWSPYLRKDLMMNKMMNDAMFYGHITISNPRILRPILYIQELADTVISIIESGRNPGVYNLASFNAEVGEMASAVAARFTHVDITTIEAPTAYSFSIDSQKARDTFSLTTRYSIDDVLDSLLSSPRTAEGVRDDEGIYTKFAV